jgi:hypothetical protein
MKHFLLLSFLFLVSIPALYAESSEDIYTIEQACSLTPGIHLGQIIWLAELYDTVFPDSNYYISSFHHVIDYTLGDSLIFTVNDGQLHQRYSKLFFVTCRVENREASQSTIFGKRSGVQYSPEVTAVNRQYIILEDWENIWGKSYHVTKVFDRTKNNFYTIDKSTLIQLRTIRTFVRNREFSWTLKSYSAGQATLEILVGNRTRVFQIKLN